jgi:nucleotide-binding universal stress UspA family protein
VLGPRRVIVGVSSSPGCLPALRYARSIALRERVPLLAVHAWVPPGGDVAERRVPSPDLRKAWAEAASTRLRGAIVAAWGGIPGDLDTQCLVVRGEPGVVLVDVAGSFDDLLVVGAGRRGRLGRIWHGRVSRYCLARGHCAVLAVPPASPVGPASGGVSGWSFRHRGLTADQAAHTGSVDRDQ